jgi:hypothetical protein
VYEEFILKEREFGKKFLESRQIFEDRFNENEYCLIKILFEDEEKIIEIYSIIDDIVKIGKMNWESRFLILGDFVFSMGSFNIDDPANLILKTSRSAFIANIQERCEINKIFGYEPSTYLYLHKRLLIGLRDKKILERNTIRIKNKDWETIVYFRLNVGMNVKNKNSIGVSEYPFIVDYDKKYSIGSFRNIWILKRKRKEMEDFPICIESIIKSNSLKMKINKELYNMNIMIIEEEKKKILDIVECKNVSEYFNKLDALLYDKRYFKNLSYRNECLEKNIMGLKVDLKEEFKKILEYFQKVIPFCILQRDIIYKKHYLPCFIDNRGRQYFGTLISPTFYKMFRYLYSFVEEKEIKNLEESLFYKKIIKYKNLVSNFELNDEKSYLAIVLLIEIGKHFIETKNECFIKTEDIILSGIRNFKEQEKKLKFEETLYVNKIKNELCKLLKNENIDLNTIIFKDATASGLQNYGVLLGYKKDMLMYLNIDGDDWCDTYQYLIDKFVGKNTRFCKRKYWKNTIMTIPYNSVWYSCFIKFVEKIREDGIEYSSLSEEDKNNIKSMHKKFYDNIKENVKKEFFEGDDANFIEFKYNEWKIIKKREYKVTYKKLRDKYTELIYDINEDIYSTIKAREANNMHYLDAKLVKKIIETFDIIPIHDCFGMRLCELHLVIDEINKYYSKIVGKETYNIHIIK